MTDPWNAHSHWHASWSTDFACAGRTVHVAVIGLRADSSPIFDLRWSSRPASLSAADISSFEGLKWSAVRRLEARVAQTLGKTT